MTGQFRKEEEQLTPVELELVDEEEEEDDDGEEEESSDAGDVDIDDGDSASEGEDDDGDREEEEVGDSVPSGSGSGSRSQLIRKNPLAHKNGRRAKKAKVDDAKDEDDDDDSSSFEDFSDSDSDDDDDEKEDQDQDEHQAGDEGDEPSEEDALIAALKKARERPDRPAPPEIRFRDMDITDLSFNPQTNLIAVASVQGSFSLFEYTNEANTQKKRFQVHKKAVRSLEFDAQGKNLFSASLDKSWKITDVETSQVKHKVLKSHDCPLYKIKPINEFLCATGDEDGTVKLWDSRQSATTPVMEEKQFNEFVSDFYVDNECRTMVASSGEGTLCSYSLRGRKHLQQSEVYEGEMNCLDIVHKSSKLVAGCGDGRLYMYNWNEFCYHSADFPGHPDAINHLVAVTDKIIISACEDGVIRAVHLYPNKFLGVVGSHDHGFPIERLDVNSTGELVASISHDKKVKFWNIGYLENMEYNKSKKPYYNRMKHKVRRKDNRMDRAKEEEHQLPSSHKGNKKDFFKELE